MFSPPHLRTGLRSPFHSLAWPVASGVARNFYWQTALSGRRRCDTVGRPPCCSICAHSATLSPSCRISVACDKYSDLCTPRACQLMQHWDRIPTLGQVCKEGQGRPPFLRDDPVGVTSDSANADTCCCRGRMMRSQAEVREHKESALTRLPAGQAFGSGEPPPAGTSRGTSGP